MNTRARDDADDAGEAARERREYQQYEQQFWAEVARDEPHCSWIDSDRAIAWIRVAGTSCYYSPDCPACLRGRAHTQYYHLAAIDRATAQTEEAV